MNYAFAPDKLRRFQKLSDEYLRRVAKDQHAKRGWYDKDGVRQGGLIAFVRYFWHVIEPDREFVDGWPLWAMCEHLEAVTFGEVTRLLINVPPGFMKSLLVNVFWPAWEWGPMKRTHYRYVAFSYSASLTERDNDRFRNLITSESYQKLYGPMRTKTERKEITIEETNDDGQVELRNKTTIKVMNTRTGWKLASSVGGVGTGERGDRVIIDDPHNVTEAESDRIRAETGRWFRESISSRFNDLDTGALIIIMQRVHSDDVAGIALSPDFDYCHLMIPWEFDSSRVVDDDNQPIATGIGWVDPRLPNEPDDDGNWTANDDEPAWPERFSDDAMARTKRELGIYAFAAQYQQSPVPRGGGLFKRHWWKVWAPEDGKFPMFDYVIGSLDAAVTEKEENCPAGFTVWGVFKEPEGPDFTGVMLVDAWRKRLNLHGEDTPREGVELYQLGDDARMKAQRDLIWHRRASHLWGLVEWVAWTCKLRHVDLLLIECEKGGIAAAQEMERLYGNEPWSVQLRTVVGDKYARAYGVVPMFSQGKIWAPVKDWSEMVIEEAEAFPRHRFKDLTDSMTMALRYLRESGLLQTNDEVREGERQRGMHRPQRKALYPV